MERILAAMTPDNSSIRACIHALNLAKRINAHVFFLVLTDSVLKAPVSQHSGENFMNRIETLIEQGRADGVPLEYYRADGDHASQLVDFVKQNKITLLVIAAGSDAGDEEFIRKLHHRLDCRIEVVQMKPLI